MQINHSLLTHSTKDLAESIVSHGCKSMVSIYYSWLFFCRIHGKKQETEQFHLKFLSHEWAMKQYIYFDLLCEFKIFINMTLRYNSV